MHKDKIIFISLVLLLVGSSLAFRKGKEVKAQTVPEAPESQKMANPYGEPIQIKATAYCSCTNCCGHSHGITKSGRKAVEGLTVASNIYFGKTVVLYDENMEFIGIYEVMDTGTDHIDIYMDSHQRALEFGVHYYYIQAVDAVG